MRLVVKDMYRSQQGVQLVEGWISFFFETTHPSKQGLYITDVG